MDSDSFRISDQDIKASKNDIDLPCSITLVDENQSVKKIKIENICFALDCGKDSSHSIKI